MTHRHSHSQPDLAKPTRSLRLVHCKAGQSRASQRTDGIRPTRKGPWDPCRFQEYELSPEFRKQVMLVKLPPADPKIFQDTTPATQVTGIDPARLDSLMTQRAELTPRETPDAAHLVPRSRLSKSTGIIAALVVTSVVLALISEYWNAPTKTTTAQPSLTDTSSPAANESAVHVRP